MIDHQPTTPNINEFGVTNNLTTALQQQGNQQQQQENIFSFLHSNSNSSIISSISNNDTAITLKNQQQKRLKSLQQMLQQRLQKEISDTDERIRRYSEQQFALLKSFREKTEQEYQLLINLVNQVPDDLKLFDAIDDNNLLTTTTTTTTTTPTLQTEMKAKDNTDSSSNLTKNMTINSTNLTTTNLKGAINNNRQGNQQPPSVLVLKQHQQTTQEQQQQIPNLETPPGTPENIPMSVGSSPVFRPHQQNNFTNGHRQNSIINYSSNDDCLFELDDFEVYQGTDNYQNMSDVEECEDAADALGELTNSMNIPKNIGRRGSNSIAKSLPIKIANMGSIPNKYDFDDLEDEVVEDTVDIAASIKALAKSVHGNAIFGELPRPRFSTKI